MVSAAEQILSEVTDRLATLEGGKLEGGEAQDVLAEAIKSLEEMPLEGGEEEAAPAPAADLEGGAHAHGTATHLKAKKGGDGGASGQKRTTHYFLGRKMSPKHEALFRKYLPEHVLDKVGTLRIRKWSGKNTPPSPEEAARKRALGQMLAAYSRVSLALANGDKTVSRAKGSAIYEQAMASSEVQAARRAYEALR